MATLYRVHALETDTRIERFDMATPTRTAAESRAELWASRYDGKNGATWCTRSGSDYIVGRL